jgi:hypothetical protein
MAPRNFQQPFNRSQFHANEQNAPRSLMAVTETRRWRHSWPTFPDEVRCDSAERFAGHVRKRLKRQQTSTIHLLRGAAKGSIARSPAARALALQVRQGHNKGHARTGQQGRPTRLGDEAPSHRFRRQSLQRAHSRRFWRDVCHRVTGTVDQAISASCTRSPYRKG